MLSSSHTLFKPKKEFELIGKHHAIKLIDQNGIIHRDTRLVSNSLANGNFILLEKEYNTMSFQVWSDKMKSLEELEFSTEIPNKTQVDWPDVFVLPARGILYSNTTLGPVHFLQHTLKKVGEWGSPLRLNLLTAIATGDSQFYCVNWPNQVVEVQWEEKPVITNQLTLDKMVKGLAYSCGLLAVSFSKTDYIELYRLDENRKYTLVTQIHSQLAAANMFFLPDNKLGICGESESGNTIKVWDTHTNQFIKESSEGLNSESVHPWKFRILPDNKHLLCYRLPNLSSLHIRNFETLKPTPLCYPKGKRLNDVTLLPQHGRIILKVDNKLIYLSLKCMQDYHKSAIQSIVKDFTSRDTAGIVASYVGDETLLNYKENTPAEVVSRCIIL